MLPFDVSDEQKKILRLRRCRGFAQDDNNEASANLSFWVKAQPKSKNLSRKVTVQSRRKI